MRDVYIVDAVRTPIARYCGALSGMRPDDLAAFVIRELLKRQDSIEPKEINDVYIGCANQAGEDNRNVARMAVLLAGLPVTVPGETVNRLCASGMSAVIHAAREIQTGGGDLYIAGGVESMTRAPYVISKSAFPYGRTSELFDTTMGWRFINPALEELYGTDSMGQTAENVADKFSISRKDQDSFAAASQRKCAEAVSRGRMRREIVKMTVPRGKKEEVQIHEDEFPRPDTTETILAKLRPAFKPDGTVTAGNSSGINDGACAILLASEESVQKFGLKPQARFVDAVAVGVDPAVMGIGPVEATRRLLQRNQMTLDQVDIIELNEAFASQSVACLRELGIAEDDSRVNPNGGAIALGHPLGMTGARLVQTAVLELQEQEKQYALCTLCVGLGQGVASLIERVA